MSNTRKLMIQKSFLGDNDFEYISSFRTDSELEFVIAL